MANTHISSREPASTIQPERSYNPWVVLLVLTGGMFMIMLDTTIVNVAQQKIREGLNANLTEIQWVLDAYLFAFAVLILTFGRFGDVFGRKRLFVMGLAVFTAASALCAASAVIGDALGISASTALIGARLLQGVGGAMLMPQTLALITVAFPPDRRGAALGIWGATTALGAVAGPIVGGLIATNFAWEWVFLINIPVGVVAIAAALYFIPESSDAHASRRTDLVGILLSGAGIFGIIFALIEGSNYGWTSPLIVGLFSAGVVFLALFIYWESKFEAPMVNLSLFKIRNFSIGASIGTLMAFGMFGIFFPLTIFLQGILGYTPIRAGLTMVPMAITIMIIAPITGKLSDRFGSRWLLMIGLVTAAAGVTFLNVSLSLDASWLTLFPALVMTGIGMGLTFPPMTNAAMKQVPPRISGSASGVINVTRNIGQILGIAVLGSLLQGWASSEARSELASIPVDQGVKDQIVDIAAEGRLDLLANILPGVEPALRSDIGLAVQHAFLTSMNYTMAVAAVFLVGGATLAFFIRDVKSDQRVDVTEKQQEAVPVAD